MYKVQYIYYCIKYNMSKIANIILRFIPDNYEKKLCNKNLCLYLHFKETAHS